MLYLYRLTLLSDRCVNYHVRSAGIHAQNTHCLMLKDWDATIVDTLVIVAFMLSTFLSVSFVPCLCFCCLGSWWEEERVGSWACWRGQTAQARLLVGSDVSHSVAAGCGNLSHWLWYQQLTVISATETVISHWDWYQQLRLISATETVISNWDWYQQLTLISPLRLISATETDISHWL